MAKIHVILLPILVSLITSAVALERHVFFVPSLASAPATATTTAQQSTASAPNTQKAHSVKKVTISKPTAPKPTTTPVQTQTVASASSTTQTTNTITMPNSTKFAQNIAAYVHTYINEERQQNSLSALALDSRLTAIAEAHSADMLAHNYFSHTDLGGCDSVCHYNNAGYTFRAMGENIYMESGYQKDAQDIARMVVDGWMNSPEHRANILNGSFTQEGIGIAASGDSVYATEDLSLPQ